VATKPKTWVLTLLLLPLPLLAGSCALHSREDEYARRLREAVEARVAEYGPAARARLAPWFESAAVAYPPPAVVLAGFKHERDCQR
jgi:hypothetical protein